MSARGTLCTNADVVSLKESLDRKEESKHARRMRVGKILTINLECSVLVLSAIASCRGIMGLHGLRAPQAVAVRHRYTSLIDQGVLVSAVLIDFRATCTTGWGAL